MKWLADFTRKTFLWVLLAPIAAGLLGAASNQLVIIANHGKFPVMLNERIRVQAAPDVNGLLDDVHCVMTSETHLNALADVFDFRDSTQSIGDLFIELAYWLWIFAPTAWVVLVLRKLIGG